MHPKLSQPNNHVDVEAIKRGNPLAEVVALYNITLRRVGQHLVGLCPFHVEQTPSFHVDPATDRWRCFGQCSLNGRWRDVIDFIGLQEYGLAWDSQNSEMFLAVIAILDRQYPVEVRAKPLSRAPTKRVDLSPQVLRIFKKAANLYQSYLWSIGNGPDTPLAYLLSRGFTYRTIRTARLGYCPGQPNLLLEAIQDGGISLELVRDAYLLDPNHTDREFLRGRIVFPNFDCKSNVTYMVGRKWAGFLKRSPNKYLALKGLTKPLYDFDRLDPDSEAPVLVSESLPDWLTLLQWGMDAVCTLGTALKESHAALLRSLHRPLGLVAQNDGGTGLEAARYWQQAIGRGVIIEMPMPVKDVNDLCVAGGREMFLQALLRLFP